MHIIAFDFDDGRLAIAGGPGGWNITRTRKGDPPVVDIIAVTDDSSVVDLVERSIRGDRHAAEQLFLTSDVT